ncbi:MAG: SPOR domain-containing protein [Bryobacteraceae bacterium]|nr:SPOR domain-containing protein [Bryobacteraceae bacterium]MCX7603043.1 SPOR domain-containing protein [Bryobacteraceae bacterium]
MTMPARDEGEFELILGNRQIILVFFILVLLLGLFFAIGFLVGRSIASKPSAQQQPVQVPISVDATKSAAREVVSAPPAAEKQPEAKTEQAAPPEEPAAKQPEPAPKQAAVPGKLFVEQPPSGTYLQAAATQRADAETMLSYLISKTGLTGYVTPSPKSPELCRVLIGPLSSNEQIADARAKLNALGVTNAILVKY